MPSGRILLADVDDTVRGKPGWDTFEPSASGCRPGRTGVNTIGM